jgi:hypothetical protein
MKRITFLKSILLAPLMALFGVKSTESKPVEQVNDAPGDDFYYIHRVSPTEVLYYKNGKLIKPDPAIKRLMNL